MSTDIRGNFSPLDELIQLIYQGIHQFVVLSSVTDDKWMVHVGMVGDAGRWWRGVWEERDIVSVVGPKPSDKLLETFVDRLVDSIGGGELYLAGFSTEKGAKIKLTFGSSGPKPVSMNLEEIEAGEAAAHATNVFLEIALHAQSRKCRLHPSAFTSTLAPTKTTEARESAGKSTETGGTSSSSRLMVGPKILEPETHDVEMKWSGGEMKPTGQAEGEIPRKRMHSPPENKQPRVKAKGLARPLRGGSLASSNKKARKIQAMDFESDDE